MKWYWLLLVWSWPLLAEKPNIVLIMLDDAGADAFSAYYPNPVNDMDIAGQPGRSPDGGAIQTPTIDRLAAEGVRFLHAYSQPLCTPTRVQIMTGKYNYRNYRAFWHLDNVETTFAQVLRENGYRTGIYSKWQLSDPGNHPSRHDSGYGEDEGVQGTGPTANNLIGPNVTARTMRDDFGFDDFVLHHLNFNDTSWNTTTNSRYWNPRMERPAADGESSEVIPGMTNSDYGPDVVYTAIETFIQGSVSDQTPFLVYWPMGLPHDPWVATPDSADPSEKFVSTSAYVRTFDYPGYFDDNVEYVDKLMSQLLDLLDDPNQDGDSSDSISDKTVLIFTSDNGTSPYVTVSNDGGPPIQGDKGKATFHGNHVPFIVRWPGTLSPGLSNRLVDFTDLFPTFLELAGIPRTEAMGLDGKAILNTAGEVQDNRDIAYVWYNSFWGSSHTPGVTETATSATHKLYGDGRFYAVTDRLEQTDLSQGTLTAQESLSRNDLQAVLDKHAASQARNPLYLNGFTRQVSDTNLDGLGDSRANTILAVGDNGTDSQEYRIVSEFDLSHPRAAHLKGNLLGAAILHLRVTRILGTAPSIRVVAMTADENGDVETGSSSQAANDFQAAGQTVTTLTGLQEGQRIQVDVTSWVKADLPQNFTSFRLEGVGINPPATPGADQVRFGGDVGVGAGRETSIRLELRPKGDVDGSGHTGLEDFHLLRQAIQSGSTGAAAGDHTGDGQIDEQDIQLLWDDFDPLDPTVDLNHDGRPDLLDALFLVLEEEDVIRLPRMEFSGTTLRVWLRRTLLQGIQPMLQRSPGLGAGADWQHTAMTLEGSETINPDGTREGWWTSNADLPGPAFWRVVIDEETTP